MYRGNIYVGVDLHKRSFTFVMVNELGDEGSSGRCSTSLGSVLDFASRLDSRHHVGLEPLENAFWFVSQIRPYAGSVHVANSYKVRLIAESRLKNDRVDARILADLLRVGYFPEVYIPGDTIIDWRRLIHHRVRLVRDRTRLKNRILCLINGEGQKIDAADAFGRKGRSELDSVELSSSTRRIVDNLLTNLDLLTVQIKDLDVEIEGVAEIDPVVKLLKTIDGVGSFTALAIRSAIGEIERFRSAKAFASYTGLIPGYRHSGDKQCNGPITKRGVSTLRWVLIQAVPHAVRHSEYLKKLYFRICYRSSVGKAKVAVAHALARIIYHVWREARPYYR